MNLIETINDNTNLMHLTDIEKVRYIYLFCCQLFSFDSRYFFCDLWHDTKLKKEIENKEYDLRNLDYFNVICHTISDKVLKQIIEELTSYKVYVERGNIHSSIKIRTIDNPNRGLPSDIKLDPSCDDLAKVKCGIKTYDFEGINFNELDGMDASLGFNLISTDDFQNKMESKSYFGTLMNIKKFLDKCKFKQYSDAMYVFRDFAPNDVLYHTTYVDRNYNFISIIENPDDERYFEICKKDGYYQLLNAQIGNAISIQNSSLYRCKR